MTDPTTTPGTGLGGGRTVVSFHAHPDDEALLTGGTLAKAAAQGHRVILVTATAGAAGLAAAHFESGEDLGRRRLAELERAAAALGCAAVEVLGYDDSGMDGSAPGDAPFASADVEAAATRLAAILRRENADVLTIYDPRGGYGHPDHVQVHRVGVRAAEMAGTPVVLEATVNRDLLRRALRLMRIGRLGTRIEMPPLDQAFTPRSSLTHRIDVRDHLDSKRAAMAAHASQASADGADRTLALFLRLPAPVFRLLLGHEWFVQHGVAPGRSLRTDILAVRPEGSA